MKNKLQYDNLLKNPKLTNDIREELIKSKNIRFEIEKLSISEEIVSKLGGYPDMSEGFNYPVKGNHYYEFVCQINLKELKIGSLLPSEGLLSFFIYDDTYRTNVPNKIIYQEDLSNLKMKKYPEGYVTKCESFDTRDEFQVLKLKFNPSISINEKVMQKAYDQIQDESIFTGFSSENQLLGDEIGWREPDYQWIAYLSKKGLNYIYPFVQHHKIAKYSSDKKLAINDIKNKILLKQKELKVILNKHEKSYIYYEYLKEHLESLEKNIDS